MAADVSGAHLHLADLAGARLCKSSFHAADLGGANLFKADLHQTNFYRA
ncbi:MAG: hypothetical protein GWN62_36035, partial [Aliifodinibius sp.]|nr:hypothetical protein [Fodinibius sp.]NIW80319.1 hypothetical protein [Calditrichia bacterium]